MDVAGVREARRVARQSLLLLAAVIAGAATCGCVLPGWYRAVGHYPGIAPSDYAFYYFNGTASQVMQFDETQVQTSALEALADFGFKVSQAPAQGPDGSIVLQVRTPDGRPAEITITPQNEMANLRMTVGPVCVGDEMLSRDLFRRVALNLGTLPRNYLPLEPTLARRVNFSRGLPPRVEHAPPPPLQGEGLRPDERRYPAEDEGIAGPETAPTSNLSSPFSPDQPFIPTRDNPNPPNVPYAPFPYTPFNADQN